MICKHKSTKLNSFKYCYVSLTIQLNVSQLFKQFNDQVVRFLTIQFSFSSQFFAVSLNVKQFFLIHRYYPIRWYHTRLGCTWKTLQWRGTPNSPTFHYYLSLTIILFNVILRRLVGRVLPSLLRCSWCLIESQKSALVVEFCSVFIL